MFQKPQPKNSLTKLRNKPWDGVRAVNEHKSPQHHLEKHRIKATAASGMHAGKRFFISTRICNPQHKTTIQLKINNNARRYNYSLSTLENDEISIRHDERRTSPSSTSLLLGQNTGSTRPLASSISRPSQLLPSIRTGWYHALRSTVFRVV